MVSQIYLKPLHFFTPHLWFEIREGPIEEDVGEADLLTLLGMCMEMSTLIVEFPTALDAWWLMLKLVTFEPQETTSRPCTTYWIVITEIKRTLTCCFRVMY